MIENRLQIYICFKSLNTSNEVVVDKTAVYWSFKVFITPEKRPIWSNFRYQELSNEVYMNDFE